MTRQALDDRPVGILHGRSERTLALRVLADARGFGVAAVLIPQGSPDTRPVWSHVRGVVVVHGPTVWWSAHELDAGPAPGSLSVRSAWEAGEMSYETITWETADGVGRLTLDRPEHRNGITGVMMNELFDATRRAAADESLRVVVLTGAGSSFCVGADLKHYSSGANDPGAPLETFDVTRLLHEMPAVTIAAINGAAAGAGFGWACACDLRFATASAVFNSAFLDVAVAGDMAGPWSLPRLVGAAKARELYFMPGRFDADEAKRIGLVIDVFDDDRFAGEVERVVDRLAAAAPLAIRGMKANFLAGETMTLADYVEAESRRHLEISASADTAEAFSAFVEKRTPTFEGR